MFCSLALAVLDTRVWRFEIAFMATLFEIEGDLKYEVVFATSNNRYGYRDLEHSRKILGFVPDDTDTAAFQ